MDYTFKNLNNTIAEWVLDGIECEMRGIQKFEGPGAASWWWFRNYAHKYPLYRWDTWQEKIVKRENT